MGVWRHSRWSQKLSGATRPKVEVGRQGVIDAVLRAVELGLTYFDTAAGYGNGEGEAIFSEALSQIENRVFLATKLPPSTQ
ncbi:MAG TPA: hypothetical protein DCF78_10310, partial [Dehalococcoidia bacterium]|nr:hypothetical protein [Dehalococcoidia bacterium]